MKVVVGVKNSIRRLCLYLTPQHVIYPAIVYLSTSSRGQIASTWKFLTRIRTDVVYVSKPMRARNCIARCRRSDSLSLNFAERHQIVFQDLTKNKTSDSLLA